MTLPWRLLQQCHHPLLTSTRSSSAASNRAGGAMYGPHRRLFTSIKKVGITFPKWMPSSSIVGSSSSAPAAAVMLGSCCALVAVVVVVVVAAPAMVSTDLEKSANTAKDDDDEKSRRLVSYQIPVDFMDKLEAKPYLHFADYNLSSRHRRRRDDANDDDDDNDNDYHHPTRPVGVPRNLRLLAVDLPEVRHGFSGGQCRVAADHVFPDGIAPPVLLQLHHPSQPQRRRRGGGHEQQEQDDDDNNDEETDNGAAKKHAKKNKSETRRNKNKKKSHHDHLDAVTVSVEQKAWVKSMFRCVHHNGSSSSSSSRRVGVRVMEAQTAALNPLNLQKTPHPLLLGRTNSQQQQQESVASDDTSAHDEKADTEQEQSSSSSKGNTNASNIIKSHFTWRSSPHDEQRSDSSPDGKKKTSDKTNSSIVQQQQHQQDLLTEAPWNQHAWREELELRISGQVAFGDTMQEASGWWNRHVLGRIYQPTIPLYSRRRNSISDWIFFWRPRRSGPTSTTTTRSGNAYLGRDEGGEGRHDDDDNDEEEFVVGDLSQSNWSFHHKPHAVIANGSALQRVPHSLRLLQKACREHNVPLYVIRNPRKWGASGTSSKNNNNNNTRNDDDDDELGAVLRDLRRTLKKRIVTTSLQQQQLTGSRTAFQRGRWRGQLETNMYWESRETMRKSRETVEHLVQNAKALAAAQKREDWSLVDMTTLEEKLVRHGVVRKENVKVIMSNNDDDDDSNEEETGKRRQTTKTMQRRIYSNAFSALAQQWVADQQAEKPVVAQNDGMPENKKQEHSSDKDEATPHFDKSTL